MAEPQVRILLTGGIGSGKSSVGQMLSLHGALVIDADEVGHQVLEPGGEAFALVTDRWPSVVQDGVINRRHLANIVFQDPAALEQLEGFTHSAIRRRLVELIECSSERVLVIEVPLLTDFMGEGWVRVVVDAEPAARLERLLNRGMDEEDAAHRMAAQPTRAEWRAFADLLIDNSGDPGDLRVSVEALWAKLIDGTSRTDDGPDR